MNILVFVMNFILILKRVNKSSGLRYLQILIVVPTSKCFDFKEQSDSNKIIYYSVPNKTPIMKRINAIGGLSSYDRVFLAPVNIFS